MRISFVALLLIWLAASSNAQEAISPKTLVAIKRATVFVKVDGKGINGSGSGFIVKVEGETALIVTNHHVIEPKIEIELRVPSPMPPKIRPGKPFTPSLLVPRTVVSTLKNLAVTVVLDSGTKNERSYKAEVLAVDPQRDLALLRIAQAANLPSPIDYAAAPELVETLPVYTFGFPFGKVLSVGKSSPAITVGKATISSLREDAQGDLAFVQIDGALNPGNSGGPIVDAKGQLVGVAVATIRNSSGIGLAIPGAELRKMFAGRLGIHHATASAAAESKTTVSVEVAVIDPSNRIKSVTLHYLAGSQVLAANAPQDSLESVPGVKKMELTLEKHLATGTFTLDAGAKEKDVLLQTTWTDDKGQVRKSPVIRQSFTKMKAVVKVKERPESMDLGDKDGYTAIAGGAFDPLFKDESPADGLLIGLECGLGAFVNKDNVKALRPIYRSAQGEETIVDPKIRTTG